MTKGDSLVPADTLSADDSPKVLVLLAVHNGARWLDQQLRSVFDQKEVTVSVLACDDASSDGSAKILADHRAQRPNQLGLHTALGRLGSAARNFIELLLAATKLPAAGAEYFAFCDQDDVWLPEKLSRATSELRRSGASGYSCSVEAFWPEGRRQVMKQSPRGRQADFYFEGAGQGCTFVMTSSLACEIAAAIEAHPVDVAFHDWLTYALARSLGHHWHFDRRPFLLYRQHGTNAIGARASLSGLCHRLRLLYSGWYGDEVLKITTACSAIAQQSDQARIVAELVRHSRRNLLGRIRLCAFVLRHGRRKRSDRLILGFMALARGI